MLPSDEVPFAAAAMEEVRARNTLSGADGQPPDKMRHHDLHRQLCDDARTMRETCPTLWDVLDKMSRPRPHDNPFLSPSQAMTFGEKAAYQMGQDAIGQWLRGLADDTQEEQAMEIPHDEQGF